MSLDDAAALMEEALARLRPPTADSRPQAVAQVPKEEARD
jgi:hypothetical protein